MTTPPIDANIQARIDKAIDEKFFGMESLNLQEGIDDLKSRVESIEESDLQVQINTLSKLIADQSQILIQARRSTSKFLLTVLQAEILMVLYLDSRPNRLKAREYVVTSVAARQSALNFSDTPEDDAHGLYREWRERLTALGYGDLFMS